MVRTRFASLAKGKAKLCQPPTRTSPRLKALWSNTAVQIPTPTPDVPVKKQSRQLFCQRNDKTLEWRERAPLEGTLELHKEDTNLEQNEEEPVAEVVGRVDLPKNDVYDALWAMLDAESDNEAA
ncbi:hypothetical protein PIB30_008505 [Stylosanthes scabra]|uniref:Uncharacterized protein n=1 Tax=Stylosanthes scabra TaxID=79078 RepID=A0ABU6Y2Z3_9FABA|nr:hypothetical protein [Stylosanthes scabra]